MKVYHRTPKAEAILKEGFRDGDVRTTTPFGKAGVYVSDIPLGINTRARGLTSRVMEVPDEVLGPLELVQEGLCYREFLISASVLNQYGPPEISDHDFKGETYTGILIFIANGRSQGSDMDADYLEYLRENDLDVDGPDWLEADIPLLQEHCLFANESDNVGLEQLKGQTKLKYLRLSNDKVTDAGLVHLKGLSGLRELDLNGIKVTDAGLVHLKGLTKLEHLHLDKTQVTDAGLVHLAGMTKLTRLNLRGAQVTDAGLVHLKGMKGLKILNLDKTKITDAGLKNIQQALPMCIISKFADWNFPG